MKKSKPCTPEYLSEDILDDGFVGTFMMFYRLQYILGSSRIEVKDQFVTVPTSYQKCYTIFCSIITVLLNIIVIEKHYTNIEDATVYRLSVIAIWTVFATYLAITVNARFCNGQSNADFIIRMQKIDRLMGLDKIKDINHIYKRINTTWMIVLLCTFFVMIIVACTKQSLIYLTFTGAIYSEFIALIELIYCSNILIYFVVRHRFLNCIMRNHLGKKIDGKKKLKAIVTLSNRSLRALAINAHSFASSDTDVYLKELFHLFSMFEMLYRFQLFIYCFKLVIGCIWAFGLILFSIQKDAVDTMEALSIFVFTVIDILIAIFLGFRLQMFFGEVKETKRLSIAMMAAYTSGPLREKAKRMLRMAEETPPKLSIYDMYNMDAGIFLTIFSLITSLIVTLLQFAFL